MQSTSLPDEICVDIKWYVRDSSPFWPPDAILVRFPFIDFHVLRTLKDNQKMSYDVDLDSSIVG